MAVVNPLLRPVGLTLLIIAALILLALTRRDVFWPLVAAASSAGVLAYVIDNAMKLIVDRGRPPAYLPDVLFHGYPTDPRGSGYPSSHAAVAVRGDRRCLAMAGPTMEGDRHDRRGDDRPQPDVRGGHFPLDIVGGVAVGLMSGGIVLVVAQRLSLRRAPTTV